MQCKMLYNEMREKFTFIYNLEEVYEIEKEII